VGGGAEDAYSAGRVFDDRQDELLDQLGDGVRAGKTNADPAPYDDPIPSPTATCHAA
jgi:hypothetical protein